MPQTQSGSVIPVSADGLIVSESILSDVQVVSDKWRSPLQEVKGTSPFLCMNWITTVDDEVSWGDFRRHRLWCCFSLCGGKRRLNELQIYRIWILWVTTQTYHQVFTTVSHSRRWCDVKLPISQSAACVVQHFGGTEVQQKEREMSKILKTAEE